MLTTRYLGPTRRCRAIGVALNGQAIEQIYVINLDRHTERWDRMCGELSHLMDNSGRPVSALARRFRAVDARQLSEPPTPSAVRPSYSLADQFFVEPHPVLDERFDADSWDVEMTRQEVAVALSHIAIWELVAAGNCTYTLVLEDDVYFKRGFCRDLDKAWSDLISNRARPAPDLLYVSYKEAKTGKRAVPVSDSIFRPVSGLWHLSGYVVSRKGARRLLDALPVRGPVDTWMNHQLEALDVFATRRSIVEQRSDCRSANVYSILPVLSQVGVLTREKPLLVHSRPASRPVFAFGDQGSGLTAIGVALSMLGYRCCSDLTSLPTGESERLVGNKANRVFDAYVNIGSLTADDYIQLAQAYPNARFIVSRNKASGDARVDGDDERERQELVDELRRTHALLLLRADDEDKWDALCSFLGCDYPSDPYPHCKDIGQRLLSEHGRRSTRFVARDLRRDPSPWIADSTDWLGIALAKASTDSASELSEHCFAGLDNSVWTLREDTFPSNLSIFTKNNFSMDPDRVARLTIRNEQTAVRRFTSAALCSRQGYLYGRFAAEARASSVPGLITGMFLHRNSPRQEIDIEFIGKDTRRMLVNVFYNPGVEGSRMEYGYRGTPALIDLGFDASEDFHEYEIEWSEASIRWLVDGRLVYERADWDPTPVPHLPMQFNFNLWHSRSRELAGKLNPRDLPAVVELRTLRIWSGHIDQEHAVSARHSQAPSSHAA